MQNTNKRTGIRYGVISGRSINPDVMDDICTGAARSKSGQYKAGGVTVCLRSYGQDPILYVMASPVIVRVKVLSSRWTAYAGNLDGGLAGDEGEGYECYGLPAAWLDKSVTRMTWASGGG